MEVTTKCQVFKHKKEGGSEKVREIINRSKGCLSVFQPDGLGFWWRQQKKDRDFPGGAVVNAPRSQHRGSGFDPWSGNCSPHPNS